MYNKFVFWNIPSIKVFEAGKIIFLKRYVRYKSFVIEDGQNFCLKRSFLFNVVLLQSFEMTQI